MLSEPGYSGTQQHWQRHQKQHSHQKWMIHVNRISIKRLYRLQYNSSRSFSKKGSAASIVSLLAILLVIQNYVIKHQHHETLTVQSTQPKLMSPACCIYTRLFAYAFVSSLTTAKIATPSHHRALLSRYYNQPSYRILVSTVKKTTIFQKKLISNIHQRQRATETQLFSANSKGTSRGINGSPNPSRSRRMIQPRAKKSLFDRTPQETIDFIQEISQVIIKDTISSRAGPQRTLQAIRVVSQTTQEFLPQLLQLQQQDQLQQRSSGRRNSSSSSRIGGSNTNTLTSVKDLAPRILRTLFERMGATYVKLGQFIASSPTLFPPEYVLEFQKCLDQTDPLPWSTIKQVLEKEFKTNNLEKIFSSIETKPLASASIAQVHMATLRENGERVVIKVQKPGTDLFLQADLSFLYVASKFIEFISPDWERTSLSLIVSDIRASMLEELDFTLEARNTIEFRKFLQENDFIKTQATAPLVYLPYTTKRVMVMEYLDGVSLLNEETIRKMTATNNINQNKGTDVVLTALNIWSLSITSMPWFHADVHAGNLLLLKDGRIGFIDFGIVGRISPKVLNSVNELSNALAINDYYGMAQALCNMGATMESQSVNLHEFANDIERVFQRINNVQLDVDAVLSTSVTGDTTTAATTINVSVDENEITGLLLDFVAVTENNGLKLPREFGLLVKQSLYFDRYLKLLAPTVDVRSDSRVMGIVSNTSSSKGGTRSDSIAKLEKGVIIDTYASS